MHRGARGFGIWASTGANLCLASYESTLQDCFLLGRHLSLEFRAAARGSGTFVRPKEHHPLSALLPEATSSVLLGTDSLCTAWKRKAQERRDGALLFAFVGASRRFSRSCSMCYQWGNWA